MASSEENNTKTVQNLAMAAMGSSLSNAEVSRKCEKIYNRIIRYKSGQKVSQDDMVLAACVMMVDVASASGPLPQKAYGMINRGLYCLFSSKTMIPALVIQYSQSVLSDFRRTEQFAELFSSQIPLDKRTSLYEVLSTMAESIGAEDPMTIYVIQRYQRYLVPEHVGAYAA